MLLADCELIMSVLSNIRSKIEQNIVFQFLATFLCSFHTFLCGFVSKWSNNKYAVGSVVIILGSVYPLILKYTKNGQSKYPFMIGVAVCVKNIFMLIYYFARYITYLYSPENKQVYSYEYNHSDTMDISSPSSGSDYEYNMDGYNDMDNNFNPNNSSSFHPSHHHYSIDNTSHQFSPQMHYKYKFGRKDNDKNKVESNISSPSISISTERKGTSKAMMNMLASTPSKITWALNVLKSPDKKLKAKNSSLSLHKLAKNESEIQGLSDINNADQDDNDLEQIELNSLSIDAIDDNEDHESATSIASKQRKMSMSMNVSPMNRVRDKLSCCCNEGGIPWSAIRHRLKLYCYLAPNALLVLINDILALYTLSFVSVATYAVFMQVTILFIVMVRYFCLNKVIRKSQLLSVCISVMGMIVFELVELEPKITDPSQSVMKDEDAKGDMIGIGLCMVRGIFKACDLVYVEWFIHHLNEIPFYEKQAVVSVWFVVCSFLYVVLYHGNDIFINGRYLFDGFNDITWIFVGYGTFFALMIYLLILRLDSLVMGFCQQMTVLFAVSLDVVVFHTKVTASMWISAFIVVIAIIQYSVIQYEFNILEANKNKKSVSKPRTNSVNQQHGLMNNGHHHQNQNLNHREKTRKFKHRQDIDDRHSNILIDSNDEHQSDNNLPDDASLKHDKDELNDDSNHRD